MASDLESQLSKLTGSQQTMLAWSKVIESYDAVPAAFKSSSKMILEDETHFPYTVFAPAIAGFGHKTTHKTTEKLLCEIRDTIYVWERVGNQVSLKEYPLGTISDLEVGSILLFSWITISGVTKAGIASSSTIEFNTATDRYFTHFVNKLRPASDDADVSEQNREWAKFDYLGMENFKFMNFAIKSLVDGEKVIQTLWQPNINKPIFTLGWHTFYRTLALAHLTILTDKELIVIQEDERSRENHQRVRYGGEWQYIALSHIQTVSLRECADDLLALSLTLSPGERQLEIVFTVSRKQDVFRLQDALEKLIGKTLAQLTKRKSVA